MILKCCFVNSGGVNEVIVENFIWKIENLYIYLPKLASGIGFKDLSKFNEAMSVKQMWCLVHETNSLC